MDPTTIAINVVRESLQLGGQADGFDRDTYLLGALPEFNSLSIASIIASIEEQLDCEIADDEITGEIFETVGSLADFIESKI